MREADLSRTLIAMLCVRAAQRALDPTIAHPGGPAEGGCRAPGMAL